MFKNIKGREFIKQAWLKDDGKRAPQVAQMVSNFNDVSNWVATEIVKQPQQQHRVLIIEVATSLLTEKKFLEIADELEKLNNFNTLLEIIGGLNSSPVSRLKRTWEKVFPHFLASILNV